MHATATRSPLPAPPLPELVHRLAEETTTAGAPGEGWSFGDVPVHAPEGPAGSRAGGWQPGRPAPSGVSLALAGSSTEVPADLRDELPVEGDLAAGARVHHDAAAAASTTALASAAYSVGHHMVVHPEHYPPRSAADRAVLAHELRHVAAHRGPASPAPDEPVEMREDSRAEEAADTDHATSADTVAFVVQRHPITKIGKWGLKKLGKEGTRKFISKHVAKHMRRIASKPIHSVFRKPRAVKEMVTKTIREAVEIGERRAGEAVSDVLEEGAVRVTKQGGRGGKFRLVVEKEFAQAIGTKGERVLQIVLDMSGRIVTAFPRDGFKTLGLTAAGIATLSASTADAAEAVRDSVEKEAALAKAAAEASQDDGSWVEWLPIVGDLYGGSLNAGESQMIAADKERRSRDAMLDKAVSGIIKGVEDDLQKSLGPDDIAELREQVLMMITSGMDVESDDALEPAP